jgi:predicted peptidase
LIISCHGNGQKGTLTPNKLRTSFINAKLDQGLKCEFVVISPQTNGYKPQWSNKGWYKEFLDSIALKYRINQDSIFVIGYSGGGEGVCTYIKNYPFAGIATFAPVITLTATEKCILVGKKVATYYCLDDKTISSNITKTLIKHINSCELRDIDVPQFTTYYQTGGHSPWKKGLSTDSLFTYFKK